MQYGSNTTGAEQTKMTSSKSFSPLSAFEIDSMTDSGTDNREDIKGTMIDSKIKHAVLTILVEPAIKTYSKALKANESRQASLFFHPEIGHTELDHAVTIPFSFNNRITYILGMIEGYSTVV